MTFGKNKSWQAAELKPVGSRLKNALFSNWCVTWTSPQNPVYNYQAYTASQYFLFGGRLRSLRLSDLYDYSTFISTIVLHVASLPLYIIFEAKYTWTHISPAIIFVFCYLWCLSAVCFVRAAFQDPGLLPRNIHLVDNVVRNGLPIEYFNNPIVDGPKSKVELKYCTTCYIWRPVRSSHCSSCNACIMNMDHHCPFLANCVGQRNYWHFLCFLTFIVLLCALVCAQTAYRISQQNIADTPMTLFLLIYAALCVMFPASLLFTHLCFGLTGITTREYLTTDKVDGHFFLKDVCLNPFNSGNLFANWLHQWLRPRGLSTLPLRQRFSTTDTRFQEYVIGSLT
ncbi:hypothetical protein KL951_003286 [Ogataea haglerorum]|nr:hypothetical protein KL951_003286 [Ogataea haglerorum]